VATGTASLSPTGDGAGASAASSPAPSSPRCFQLYRHHDVTGQSGTGVVVEGTQWTDGTVSIRWRGDNPSFANWPSVESLLAVHGHQGATELIWLDPWPEPGAATCRVCGCTDDTACFGGCYWVAPDLCSSCGDAPGGELWATLAVEASKQLDPIALGSDEPDGPDKASDDAADPDGEPS
jgi:hypothetical protein